MSPQPRLEGPSGGAASRMLRLPSLRPGPGAGCHTPSQSPIPAPVSLRNSPTHKSAFRGGVWNLLRWEGREEGATPHNHGPGAISWAAPPIPAPFQSPLTSATPGLHLPGPHRLSSPFPKALSITAAQLSSRKPRDGRGSKHQEKSASGPPGVPGCGLHTGQLVLPSGGGGTEEPPELQHLTDNGPYGCAHMPGSAYLPAGGVGSTGRFRPTRGSPLSGRSTLTPIGARETPFLTLESIEEEEGSPCHFRVPRKWQPLSRRAT